MNKILNLSAILLLSNIVLGQAPLDLNTYTSKYPGEPVIYLQQDAAINMDVKKGKLSITAYFFEDMLMLSDKANVYNDESVEYSGWMPLISLSAKTLVPEEKKYKVLNVDDFYTNDVLSGDIFFDDSKEKTFTFPLLSKGCRRVMEYSLDVVEPRFFPSHIFGNFCPTESSTFKISCPAGTELEFVYMNTSADDLNFTKSEEKGRVTYTWKKTDVPKISVESRAPSIRYYAPHVLVYIKSYMVDGKKVEVINDVNDLHDFYYNFIDSVNVEQDAAVKKVVDSIVAGITSPDEKARKIYQWVQDNIKYVAFEAGMEGFVPSQAAAVCSKRYGDCKGMASIITDMMQMAGVDAHLVWIGTRDIPYSYSLLPTPANDNHMIAAYKTNGKFVFLDGTDSYVPFGMPSSFIQGKEALIHIEKGKYEIIKVPEMTPEQNELDEKMTLRLEGSEIIGNSTSRYSGYVRGRFTDIFKNLRPDIKEKALTSIYEIGNNTFSIDTMYPENLLDRDKDMFVHYRFKIKNYAKVKDDKIYVNLTLDKDLSSQKLDEDRRAPLEEDYKKRIYRTVTFEIPEGYALEHLPADSEYNTELYGYSIKYTQKEGQVIMNAAININFLMLEEEHFDDWNKMIKQINSAYNEVVIFKKK
jgi:hypothetical protein